MGITAQIRMHSSRMRIARSLTVSCCILHNPPGNHACPPLQPCMPPTTMHTPTTTSPHNHAHPPATTHAPGNHACPPATMHAPQQPHMPPSNHAHPPQPCIPPSNHAHPPATTHACPPHNHTPPPVDRILDTHFWKYYLAPNLFCGQ